MTYKTICILLDTNTWRRNLLLRTNLGSALLYTVNSSKIQLALPEVIEEEITKHTEIAAKEAKAKIERNFRDIQAIIGKHSPYTLPDAQTIRDAISSRFDELGSLIIKQPFTLEHAKSALKRVNENLPPSSTKKQQFKDAAIWEAALELGKSYDVYLVSNDGDFYENNNKSTLNQILKQEIKNAGITIKIFNGIEACLSELVRQTPKVDVKVIGEKIFQRIIDNVKNTVSNNNLRPITVASHDIRPFITENHDILAVEYTIILDALNLDTNEINENSDASVNVKGSCTYNIKREEVENNQFNQITANWINTNGKNDSSGSVYVHAAGVHIGREPDLPYTTRRGINEIS